MAATLPFQSTCCQTCDDPVTTQVPGPSGLATGIVNPEGVVNASLAKLYWNSANNTLWVNKGDGLTGWIQVV